MILSDKWIVTVLDRKYMKKKQRSKKIEIFCLIIGIVFFCAMGCAKEQKDDLKSLSLEKKENSSEQSEDEIQDEKTDKLEDSSKIYVYVCGAVNSPGVYELEDGARIYEAIVCAGGLRDDADKNYVNQAQILSDGEQIYIPTEEEAAQEHLISKTEQVSDTTVDGRVDINTATKEELMTLSGIGESRAESILAYRQIHGMFQDIEELMNVEGIKEGIFQKIKDSITVNTGS